MIAALSGEISVGKDLVPADVAVGGSRFAWLWMATACANDTYRSQWSFMLVACAGLGEALAVRGD